MRARVAASVGLVVLLATGLAGCNFITPQATLDAYDPSDGANVRVGDVSVLNAVVLSEDGESGNLVFTAVNASADDIDLRLQYGEGTTKINIEVVLDAAATTLFGSGDAGQLFLAEIGTEPGGLLPIYLQYGDQQGRQILVPVLDGSLEEYSDLLPTPTPTPTGAETGTPTPTPSPTP